MAGSILKHRACEGCGSRMAPWKPRHRTDDGSLVCDSCKQRTGTKRASTTKCQFDHDGDVPAAQWRVYGPLDTDEMFAVCDDHKAVAERQFPGRPPKVEKIAFAKAAGSDDPRVVSVARTLLAELDRYQALAQVGGDTIALPGFVMRVDDLRYLAEHVSPRGTLGKIHVVAHDSGDGETIYHCPFCGAGAILGKSNGTAECQFCKTSFTVQVQPARSSVPQTINGQPHVHPDMPGTAPGQDPGQMPEDPAAQTAETTTPVEDPTDEGKMYASRQYIAADGMAMREQQYLKHLAIRFADDRESVIASLRREAISFYDGPHLDSDGVPIGIYDIVDTPDGRAEVGAVYPDTPYYEGRTVQVEMEGSPGYGSYGDPGNDERDYRRFRPGQVTVIKRHPDNMHLSTRSA